MLLSLIPVCWRVSPIKLQQKRWYAELGLPTADFQMHPANEDISSDAFGFPVVQKAARGGYDGRGVFVLRSAQDNVDRLQVDGFLRALHRAQHGDLRDGGCRWARRNGRL